MDKWQRFPLEHLEDLINAHIEREIPDGNNGLGAGLEEAGSAIFNGGEVRLKKSKNTSIDSLCLSSIIPCFSLYHR